MTPAALSHIGATLYGPAWQARLADALNIGERQLRRWVKGDAPIPPGIASDLLTICGQRLDELEALFDQLEQEIDR